MAVDSLVIHFVEEDLGDPFFQFRVLAAPDQEPVQENADKITFERIANTKAPNRDQRTFRIGLEQLKANPGWQGKLVQTIRIVVSDTRGERGERISEEEWQALPADERGAIVHFIRDEQGFEEPVERAIYESLDPQRQGRLDYYRARAAAPSRNRGVRVWRQHQQRLGGRRRPSRPDRRWLSTGAGF